MSEIPNKPNHTLLPGDFFVIVSDPQNLYPALTDDDEAWPPRATLSDDLEVMRVDGDIVSAIYVRWEERHMGAWCAKHIDVDMSKIDYKRVIRVSYYQRELSRHF